MKKYWCCFTFEGDIVGSIEQMTQQEIDNYNSVWALHSFETEITCNTFITTFGMSEEDIKAHYEQSAMENNQDNPEC